MRGKRDTIALIAHAASCIIIKSTFVNRKSGFLNRKSVFFNRKSGFVPLKTDHTQRPLVHMC